MTNYYAIIVAGGTGSRIKSDVPKQFVELNGKEIIIRTIEKFLAFNNSIKIIIAVHKDFFSFLETLLARYNLGEIRIVVGGDTRFQSVKNALAEINDVNAIVGIHDAARPLVSVETISSCYKIAEEKGNAIPVVAINESIREVAGNNSKHVNRNHFKIIQTPQCFNTKEIKEAFTQPYNDLFTDDASVLEAYGKTINLVEGNAENIKITLPKDLLIAKAFLDNE